MMLLIDEDLEATNFLSALKSAGIEFQQVKKEIRAGATDDEVISFARDNNRIIVTNNGKDFNDRFFQNSAIRPQRLIWTRTHAKNSAMNRLLAE